MSNEERNSTKKTVYLKQSVDAVPKLTSLKIASEKATPENYKTMVKENQNPQTLHNKKTSETTITVREC